MRYTGRLRNAVGEGAVSRRANAVAVITGNGLKDAQSARSAAGKPFDLGPEGGELPDILSKGLIVVPS
jgi:threonine synthase